MHAHTQSAVNNFLGLHRFDSTFQIKTGSWIDPNRHWYYADGNILLWEGAMRFRPVDKCC